MDKDKLKPYQNEEELMSNAENIQKEWKKEEYKGHIFSARHVADDPEHPENCLHLYLDENYRIHAANWADWVRYMSTKEGLYPWELKSYENKLCYEFAFWTHMEAEHLAKLEEKQIRETKREAELSALFAVQALSRKSKYKN